MSDDHLAALERLDQVVRRLRRECPWDRDQDVRSIVPHTVEESYELADAAHRDDAEAMVDELGDVLFQVLFLSLLLEERGIGDLGAVAEACRAKLIRRHPHVFGDRELETAAEVLSQWEQIKREVEGSEGDDPFGSIPDNLPSLTYARKILRRLEPEGSSAGGKPGGPARSQASATRRNGGSARAALGGGASRALGVDPELALRLAADRVRASAG